MSLKKLMTEEITSLPANATILDACKFMTDMNVGSVIVMDDGKPAGVLTDRDIMVKVMVGEKDPKAVLVKDIMVSPAFTVSEDADIIDVTEQMKTHSVRRFPVVDAEGKLTGVISLDDILVFLGIEMQNIAAALKQELGK